MAIETKEASEERAKFRGLGCGIGKPLPHPSVQCDFFAEFMRRSYSRQKKEGIHLTEGRVLEWAGRFARGDVFQHADGENRQILLDIMVEGSGDGTARHINEIDAERFCKRFGEKK